MFRFDNLDAAESAFLSRQLEQIRSKTYDIKRPPLRALQYVPLDSEVGPGTETVTYRQYDSVGVAKLVSSYAKDFPRVDVLAREFTTRCKSLGASYGFNRQELRAAQLANLNLDQRKANAARRAIDEKQDVVMTSGDTSTGLLGFVNQPNVTVVTAAVGASATTSWDDKTPEEILADMFDAEQKIVEDSKEVETPTTIVLPIKKYGLIATRRMGDGSDTTILKYFLANSQFVKEVGSWNALKTAGAGSTNRMVCYRKDPDSLVGIMPVPFEQFPPQTEGMEFVTYCHGRTGGVVVYYPLSMLYVDGI